MRIGIDISQIVYGTGVSLYTDNLVKSLLKVDRKNKYLFFFSSLRRKRPDIAKIKSFKIPPTVLDLLWNRLHFLPIESFIGDVDVFHSSDWTQPPAKKAKLVTTIHDLSFLRFPETVDPKVFSVQKRRLAWVKKEVDAVIAVSQATKKEIIDLLGIPEKKIFVVYEALPDDVKNLIGRAKRNKSLEKRLGINKPYFFAYGSQAPRKNIFRLLKAFERVRRKADCQLVIVGPFSTISRLPEGVVAAGFLPRKELLSLFSQAKGLAYPSTYEGFGLPILEAFALGVPVLTSNLSSMAEVAGDGAVLVNPRSTDEIAQGLEKILKGGKEIEALKRKGRKRLSLFSWKKAARQTIKVYTGLYSGKGGGRRRR